MLIGILSDSHGRAMMVRRAMALFDALGATQIIHCGDVGGVDVFDEMVGRRVAFVWGNTDEPDSAQNAYLRSVGLTPPADVPVRLECDGKRIAVFHGHEPEFARSLRNLEVDYVFHGHTHIARDEQYNGRRIINPGALHRAVKKTAATLDTVTESVTFHEIAERD